MQELSAAPAQQLQLLVQYTSVSVFNAAGVGVVNKALARFDSIMNTAAMKLLYLVVLMGCSGQGQPKGNVV